MENLQNNPSIKKQAWLMIAACFLIQMSLYGISINLFQLYIIPVTKALGFSRGSFMVCQSIIFFSSMLGSATGWKLYQRWGMLPVVRAASVVLTLAYIAQGFVSQIVLFYLLSAIIGLCSGLATVVPLSILIRSWFKEKVGTAIGIAFMGTGVGGMIFMPIGNALILAHGWQTTYRILGIVMGIICIPIYFFLLRFGPFMEASEAEDSEAKTAVNQKEAQKNASLDSSHYLLMAFCSLLSIATSTIIFTLNPYLQDLNYSPTFASTVGAISMGALAIGKIVLGRLIDLKGIITSTRVLVSLLALGFLALILMNHWLFLIPVMLGVLIGSPYGTIMLPIIGTEVSTPSNRDQAVSMYTAAGAFGSAIGPIIVGFSYDSFQSYLPAFYGAMAITIISGLGISYFLKRFQK